MSMNKKVRVQTKGGQVFLEGDAFYVLFGVSWFWAILQILVRVLCGRSRRRRERNAYRSLRRHV